MTLYEIDERLRLLEEYSVDSETGEIISDEDFDELYANVQMDLETKIENTLCFIKSIKAEADAIKEEKKKLDVRQKQKEKLAERLTKNIDNFITNQFTNEDGELDFISKNKYKFESPRARLSYRKSQSVEIMPNAQIPAEYIKTKIEESPDKTKLKTALKSGVEIEGVKLTDNLSMTIK